MFFNITVTWSQEFAASAYSSSLWRLIPSVTAAEKQQERCLVFVRTHKRCWKRKRSLFEHRDTFILTVMLYYRFAQPAVQSRSCLAIVLIIVSSLWSENISSSIHFFQEQSFGGSCWQMRPWSRSRMIAAPGTTGSIRTEQQQQCSLETREIHEHAIMVGYEYTVYAWIPLCLCLYVWI